jgi:hypothetical protein
VWKDGLDEVIDGLTGHDKEHNATGLLQLGAEFLDGVSTNNRLACVSLASNIRCLLDFHVPLASLARKRSTLETVRL